MIEHRCSVGVRGGFFQRLRTGTYLGHILEHVTLELQTLAGTEVGFRQGPRNVGDRASTRSSSSTSKKRWPASVWPSDTDCCMAAVERHPVRSTAKEIERLRDLAHQVCLGPSTRAIVQAAQTTAMSRTAV